MNKIIVLLALLFFLLGCTESGKPEIKNETQNATPILFEPPKLKPDFLQKLYLMQMEIMKNPTSRVHKERYIFNAYYADKNTLISFGNARSTNPQSGERIAQTLIRRAAILDARRWATYGLLWLNNDFKPDFGKIKDIHKAELKEIASFNNGDSLVIVIASKVR